MSTQYAPIWNDTERTFTCLKANVTDTASNANSLLMDLQVGGSSKFNIGKTNTQLYNTYTSSTNFESYKTSWESDQIRIGTSVGSGGGTQRSTVFGGWDSSGTWIPYFSVGSTTTGKIELSKNIRCPNGTGIENANGVYLISFSGSSLSYPYIRKTSGAGLNYVAFPDNGVVVTSGGYYSWSSDNTNVVGGSPSDLFLYRDAGNILAQRNSTNPQTFRLYNTYTDASNGEWAEIDWKTTSNVCRIGTNKNGTGSARDVMIQHGGSEFATITATQMKLPLNKYIMFHSEGGTHEQAIISGSYGYVYLGPANNIYAFYVGSGVCRISSGVFETHNQSSTSHLTIRPRDGTGAGAQLRLAGMAAGGSNNNGGDVTINGGAPTGTGIRGNIILSTLPTTDPVVAGALWNDSGTLKVSAG